MRGVDCNALQLLLLLLLFLAGTATPANAVRFLLKDTHSICFVAEVDEGTGFVTGEYTRGHQQAGVAAELTITGPFGDVMSRNSLLIGTHAFSTSVPPNAEGEYKLCLQVVQRGWEAAGNAGSIVVDFNADRKTGSPQTATTPVAVRHKVGEMEVFTFREYGGEMKDILQHPDHIRHVEQALSTVSMLLKDTKDNMEYITRRFARMRYTSESTLTRIWAFSAITALVILAVTWLQFRVLKSMLRHKKLV